MMKKLLIILLLYIAFFAQLDRHFFKTNAYFNPNCILPRWSCCPQFDTPLNEDIFKILDQPFSYFSQGKQSFVFLSADGKWVIKFIRLPRYLKIGSLKGNKKSLSFLQKTMESYKYCYEELPEETGIVYAHLKSTSTLRKKLFMTDLYQAPHWIDLDQLPFVIQHRGENFFTGFKKANQKEAKVLIKETITLFNSLYDKGFIDNDPILNKNFGLKDGYPFILDVGQLEKIQTPLSRREYLEQMTNSLEAFLYQNNPDLYNFYKNSLK